MTTRNDSFERRGRKAAARARKAQPFPQTHPVARGDVSVGERHQPVRSNHLVVEQIALDAFRPHERGLKQHPERQLTKLSASIEQFGFIVPVLVDEDLRVVAGQARLDAARRIGLATVPAIRLSHLTESQIRAFRIADNRLAELGTWNEQALGLELRELSFLDLDFSLELTGFETAQIDVLIEGVDDAGINDDDELPIPASGPAVSRLGDLWRLGEHLLLCGDALKPESYDRLMAGEKARLVFTDPPYNVRVSGHVSGLGRVRHREFVMASGEMSEQQFTKFLESSLRCLADQLVDGGVLYACMDFRHHHELGTAYRTAGLQLLNVCTWVKSNAGMGSFYRSQHELVFVLKTGEAPHVNNVQLGRYGRYRTNVWEYAGVNTWGRDRQEELAMHPTVKPVALVADAIRDSSRRGEMVLDAFAGSGTTIIAAERTGRIARALELDPAYVDVCLRRWQKATGKQAVHTELGIPFDEVAARRTKDGDSDSATAPASNAPPDQNLTPPPQPVVALAKQPLADPPLAPVRDRPRRIGGPTGFEPR